MFGPLSFPPQQLYSNSFSGELPTQIGQLIQMTSLMVSQGPSTDNNKHTRTSSMRAPTNHTEPHISSITISVPNQLARLKAVPLSFLVSLNDPHESLH